MNNESKKVITRFAPSPTGFLHVGSIRTALYAYLYAKQYNGSFLLRIEDTDRTRFITEAEQNILETLSLFGLNADEEPVHQSDRLDVYKKYTDELLEKELAYKDEGAIRFRMPKEGASEFTDIVRGQIKIENKDQEDFIILKSDGFPTYNLAHLVDDHEMGITHVIRGEEFIPSMPKYVALHKAFGWNVPQYAHLPLLLNKERVKLSKRQGDVAVMDFLSKGYLVPALLNFIALLGWHPSKSDQEIFSLEELIEQFRLEDVQKAGAIFDLDKLDWFQSVWAKRLHEEANSPEEHPLFDKILKIFQSRFENVDLDLFKKLWPSLIERIGAPSEMEKLPEDYDFLFEEIDYPAEMLVWKKSDKETAIKALTETRNFLADTTDDQWTEKGTENSLKNFIQNNNYDNGTVLWPLRVALTGKEKSMSPFEALSLLTNKETAFTRIDQAINKLKT